VSDVKICAECKHWGGAIPATDDDERSAICERTRYSWRDKITGVSKSRFRTCFDERSDYAVGLNANACGVKARFWGPAEASPIAPPDGVIPGVAGRIFHHPV
jgi:hypothetical protein